jgi:hypothetical protein
MVLHGASLYFPNPARRLEFTDDEPLASSTPNSSFVDAVALKPLFDASDSILTSNIMVSYTDFTSMYSALNPRFNSFVLFTPPLKIEFATSGPLGYPRRLGHPFDLVEFPLVPTKKLAISIDWDSVYSFEIICERHCDYEIENYCDCLKRKSLHKSLPDLRVIKKQIKKKKD